MHLKRWIIIIVTVIGISLLIAKIPVHSARREQKTTVNTPEPEVIKDRRLKDALAFLRLKKYDSTLAIFIIMAGIPA